jgi:HlyD family secretion protein
MKRVLAHLSALWSRSLAHRGLLAAPVVVLLVAVGYWSFGGRSDVQYFTAKVDKGDITQVVQATGTINALTTVQVGSQVSGTISQILVDFNSEVKKGQVIARIDPAIFQARLEQSVADQQNAEANVKSLAAAVDTALADVKSSDANVSQAQARFTDARLQLERALELFAQGVSSKADRDTAQANFDALSAAVRVAQAQLEQSRAKEKSAVANLDQAKAQVAQRRATVALSRLDLDHSIIQAPIDGTVVSRNVDVGQTVAASLQAPTLFSIAQDLTKMQVYSKTDEADVGRIQVDGTATFRVDAFPREEFRGRVSQVRMNATTVQNVVTYDAIVDFDNPGRKLFPGMTAYVNIPVASAPDAIKIPNGALRFKPDMTDDERAALFAKYNIPAEAYGGSTSAGGAGGTAGGSAKGADKSSGGGGGRTAGATPRPARKDMALVWKLVASNKLEPVAVKIGVTDYTVTEMKEGALKPGDILVIGQWSGSSGQTAGSRPGASPVSGPGGLPRKIP